MFSYEEISKRELNRWKIQMRKRPNIFQKVSKGTQRKVNGILPEKYHQVITSAVKSLTMAVLYGSKFITSPPILGMTLKDREKLVREKTRFYATTATIEGAATGAGGFIAGLADFPLLLGIKFKFLYEISSVYGFDSSDYFERLYILHIFQLSFSSKSHMNKVFDRMENWDEYIKTLPAEIDEFQWREFQQEYRDYLDLAKLLQLLPVVGAFVGSYVNNKLLKQLSQTAVYSYRMRLLK